MFKKISPNCKLSCSGGYSVTKVQDVGDIAHSRQIVRDDVKYFIKDIPAPEHFSLQKQLESGVPLKEVASEVFDDTELTPKMAQKIDKYVSPKQTNTKED